MRSLTSGMPPIFKYINDALLEKVFKSGCENTFITYYDESFICQDVKNGELTNRINSIDSALKKSGIEVKIK